MAKDPASGPPDGASADPAKTALDPAKAPQPTVAVDLVTVAVDLVEVRAIGSFHEQANFAGKLLQSGDVFTCDRDRATQLRANGLVAYTDDAAEKAAAVDDLPPTTDNGQLVVTSRSIRPVRK